MRVFQGPVSLFRSRLGVDQTQSLVDQEKNDIPGPHSCKSRYKALPRKRRFLIGFSVNLFCRKATLSPVSDTDPHNFPGSGIQDYHYYVESVTAPIHLSKNNRGCSTTALKKLWKQETFMTNETQKHIAKKQKMVNQKALCWQHVSWSFY
jgi:hypothetical protein